MYMHVEQQRRSVPIYRFPSAVVVNKDKNEFVRNALLSVRRQAARGTSFYVQGCVKMFYDVYLYVRNKYYFSIRLMT